MVVQKEWPPEAHIFECLGHQGEKLFERIRRVGRCDLVGIGVILLEAVCDWGWASGFQKSKSGPESLLLLIDLDVKFPSTSPAP